MTTTKTSDINATLQQIASLVATGVRHRARGGPALGGRRGAHGDRREVDRSGRRRHPLPVEVRDGRARGRHPGSADQPGQHQVPGQGPPDRPRGQGPRRADPHRRERRLAREGPAREVRQAHAGGARRVRAERSAHPGGRGLLRHQDLGEALEPARDDRGVPPARREVRLPAAPRRDRGRADAAGRREERGRDRRAARRGDRRHDPRLAHRRPRRGGQGRHRDPAVARPAQARARPGRVPVVRPGRGRRARVSPSR